MVSRAWCAWSSALSGIAPVAKSTPTVPETKILSPTTTARA